MNKRSYKLLNIALSICIIAAALIGLLYTNGGKNYAVTNIYGDTVVLYGDGIYAYSSVFDAANLFGSDLTACIMGILLLFLTLWKSQPFWAEILRGSFVFNLVYYSACQVFGTMNRLFFLYAVCFGLSLFAAYKTVKGIIRGIEVPGTLKENGRKRTGIFLIISGSFTALIWIFSIIPVVINGDCGSLLGVKSTEITYGIDLSITCPLLIACGIWILQKKDLGYKAAPFFFNMMISVSVTVLIQRVYSSRLGIQIPVQAFIGYIFSFVLLGVVSLYFFMKLVRKLRRRESSGPDFDTII